MRHRVLQISIGYVVLFKMRAFCNRSALRAIRNRSVKVSLASFTPNIRSISLVSRQATAGQPWRQHQQWRGLCSGGDTYNMVVPGMGDSITEGSILEWEKKVGDYVAIDDVIVIVETDKVSIDIRADKAGTITALHAAEDDVVEVGAPLLDIQEGPPPEGYTATAPETTEATKAAPKAEETTQAAAATAPPTSSAEPPASPPASGKSGPPKPESVVLSGASTGSSRSEERVKMTRMRKTIARNLKDAQNTAAMLTTFQEVDMTALIGMRKEYKDAFLEKHGVKLGFMSAFIKASSAALMDIPVVNASIDGDDIIYRNYADISVAVATPTGLLTPVIRNCESLSFAEIEATLGELAVKARDKKIAMEDLTGGTFTVSNGGVYGSMMSTPIINMPQTAVLGMHATKMRPMVVNGNVEPRPVMYLAMSYDHRLIDGREAVTFLCKIRDQIEDPRAMLLGL